MMNGDSLLHLSVTLSNTLKPHNFYDENQKNIFPNYNVVGLLLHCGADINCKNNKTPPPCTQPRTP